eukprot:4788198-Alexandrium_andersonii.AAC.2
MKQQVSPKRRDLVLGGGFWLIRRALTHHSLGKTGCRLGGAGGRPRSVLRPHPSAPATPSAVGET